MDEEVDGGGEIAVSYQLSDASSGDARYKMPDARLDKLVSGIFSF